MNTGGRDNNGQDEAQRATQNMALDAPDFLVAVVSALPLLRAGYNALRVQEPGCWLRGMAVGLAHPARQIGAGLSPDTVCPKPVIPGADRLVRTEVARQRAPLAARMLQVKTGVHHLAHIGSEGKVAPEQGFDDTPFRVRQVARIASPISLVFFTIFVCPHSNLLLTNLNSPPGESVKQALRICFTSVGSSPPHKTVNSSADSSPLRNGVHGIPPAQWHNANRSFPQAQA